MAVSDDSPLLVEQLVSRGDTLAGLERLLQLSPGYLSKVRRGRVTASAQLVALLRVLARHPEVRATLGVPSLPAARPLRVRPTPSVPATFLRRLTRGWAAGGVRFHAVDDLLFAALKVATPSSLEPSVRFLVHPDDRHALTTARDLSASVAMATSRAAIVTPPASSASLLMVFPLTAYVHLFAKPKLTAIDAALYFALQTGEEAESRLRALTSARALRRDDLERRFAQEYGGATPLPAKEWLLRATFDLEGARRRLAALP